MSATETSYNQDLVLVMQAQAVRHLTITDTSNLGSSILFTSIAVVEIRQANECGGCHRSTHWTIESNYALGRLGNVKND